MRPRKRNSLADSSKALRIAIAGKLDLSSGRPGRLQRGNRHILWRPYADGVGRLYRYGALKARPLPHRDTCYLRFQIPHRAINGVARRPRLHRALHRGKGGAALNRRAHLSIAPPRLRRFRRSGRRARIPLAPQRRLAGFPLGRPRPPSASARNHKRPAIGQRSMVTERRLLMRILKLAVALEG